MKIALFAVAFFTIAITVLIFFSPYRSAFEADQACHFELRSNYGEENAYGCDHDLETRQWLLFERGLEDQPAKVVSRYRY